MMQKNIYYPCFLIKDINTEDPERPYGLVIFASPWDLSEDEERVGLRVKSLPILPPPVETGLPYCPPWAIELYDGTRCNNFSIDTYVVEIQVDGVKYLLDYDCNDGKGIFYKKGDSPYDFGLDKRDKIWKARVIDN